MMHVSRHSQVEPAPFSWPYSHEFQGNDGSWSTFIINVGGQDFNVLPSTAGTSTWVPLPQGCLPGDPSNCPDLRGVGWVNNVPSTGYKTTNATKVGDYYLGIPSQIQYFNATDVASLYTDTVGPGSANTAFPKLDKQLVFGLVDKEPLVGLFGLGNTPVTFSSDAANPWLISYCTDITRLPGCSFGYTAGAAYRDPPQSHYGSLILGGYDSARLTPEASIEYEMQSNNSISAHVKQISIATDTDSNPVTANYPAGFWVEVDSTLPFLWLPEDVCENISNILGLTYDSTNDLYLINNTVRSTNSKYSIALTLDDKPYGANITSFTLPFSAFDQPLLWPLNTTAGQHYFPIRRSPGGYALGRTFLQEAYLFVDYDRRSFNLSRAKFPDPNTVQIITIHRPDYKPPKNGLSTGTIIGIAVGVGVGVLLLLALVLWLFLRRRKKIKQKKEEAMVHEIQNYPPKHMMELPSPTATAVDARPGHSRNLSDISGGSHELESPPWKPDADYFNGRNIIHELDATTGPSELASESSATVPQALPGGMHSARHRRALSSPRISRNASEAGPTMPRRTSDHPSEGEISAASPRLGSTASETSVPISPPDNQRSSMIMPGGSVNESNARSDGSDIYDVNESGTRGGLNARGGLDTVRYG